MKPIVNPIVLNNSIHPGGLPSRSPVTGCSNSRTPNRRSCLARYSPRMVVVECDPAHRRNTALMRVGGDCSNRRIAGRNTGFEPPAGLMSSQRETGCSGLTCFAASGSSRAKAETPLKAALSAVPEASCRSTERTSSNPERQQLHFPRRRGKLARCPRLVERGVKLCWESFVGRSRLRVATRTTSTRLR